MLGDFWLVEAVFAVVFAECRDVVLHMFAAGAVLYELELHACGLYCEEDEMILVGEDPKS